MSSTREVDIPFTRYRSNSKPVRAFRMDKEDTSTARLDQYSTGQAPAYPRHPSRNPLIDYCTNEWQHSVRWKSPHADSKDGTTSIDRFGDSVYLFFSQCLAMLRAPKVRRYLLFYTVILTISTWLWVSIVWPMWAEERALARSVSARRKAPISGGLFGVNLVPAFPNMLHIKDLDPKYIPQTLAPGNSKTGHVDRLIFVGDVHGCIDELKALLEKVHFNEEKDHLVTTGDLIAKGPDTPGTVDFVRRLDASCVRGNHEDRTLLIAQSLNSSLLHSGRASTSDTEGLVQESSSLPDFQDRALAASLSAEQIAYLETCPVILRVGSMNHLAGELVVVHGGLVPGVSLDRQDPTAVMSMRSIHLNTQIPSKNWDPTHSIHWSKLWNRYQKSLAPRLSLFPFRNHDAQVAEHGHTTVIYGHDSKAGLQLKQYSHGIDTGCVRGGKLTALVLSDEGAMETVQVECKDHRQRRPLEMELEDILRSGGGRRKDDESND